jgi:hypothetical protein
MKTDYPEDYKGPVSGKSTAEEWWTVRDWQAFQWIVDGTWKYSDFDNYLYSMMEYAVKQRLDFYKQIKED